jgi:hypothetical protein
MKPFFMENPPAFGSRVKWNASFKEHEAIVTKISRPEIRGAGGVRTVSDTAWEVDLGGGHTITNATSQWTDAQPHPVDWVKVSNEYRPINWPHRFPLLEGEEKATDYWKREDVLSLEGVDTLTADDKKSIYANRKEESAIEAKRAKARADKVELQRARQAFRAMAGRV